MFIWTAKINRKKVAAVFAAAVVICASALVLAARADQTVSAPAVNPKGIKTEEDRVAYLQEWGWQVSPEAVMVEELQMPKEFDDSYTDYLALQSGQGFDLTKYAGKRVKRYTYEVLNHPTGEDGVIAHLILYKNTVIGGEVMGSGFLQGLGMPEQAS